MTATTATGPGQPTTARPGRGGVAAVAVVVVAALGLTALLARGSGGEYRGPPLAPRTTGPAGARGLVLLLEALGVQVTTGRTAPGAGDVAAVLLVDRLDGVARERIRYWVRSGGRLVVADPSSPLAADPVGSGPLRVAQGACDIAELADVEGLRFDGLQPAPDPGGEAPVGGPSTELRIESGDRSCFGSGEEAVVVQRPLGEGTVTSVGGSEPFLNALLATDDNSVLAARLLVVEVGDRPGGVAFLDGRPVGSGDMSLVDLVPDRVRESIIQLGIAVALYMLWRGRRLGRPVLEPQPVPIAGSRLVDAVGRLRRRAGATSTAAAELRDDTRRRLAVRHGLGRSAPAELVAEVAATRTGLDPERVRRALAGPPTDDDAALVALARELDTICDLDQGDRRE